MTGGSAARRHPDQDVLADFAADVLGPKDAHLVSEHVSGCPLCAGLLADAERVRSLLLADVPGPMPEDVWGRLRTALTAEAAAAQAPAPATQPAPATPATQPVPATAAPGRPFGPGPAGARPGRGSGGGRPPRGPQRTRRQVREEARSERPRRLGGALAVAAGVVVVLGLGGLVLRWLPGGGHDTAELGSPSSAAAPDAAGTSARVLHTGTNYTKASLRPQVAALLSKATGAPAAAEAGPLAPTAGSTVTPGRTVTPGAAPGPTAAGRGDEPGPTPALADPAALRACLRALDAGDRQPVAVDLARWGGRDAAIIVLSAGAAGGYEVWAVSRDCRPGAVGTLAFSVVTP